MFKNIVLRTMRNTLLDIGRVDNTITLIVNFNEYSILLAFGVVILAIVQSLACFFLDFSYLSRR